MSSQGRLKLTRLCSSSIVEDIANYCRAHTSFALAYFYFDFTNPEKQRSRALIRSFLTQLCHSFTACPEVLVELYARYQDGRQQPTEAELIVALKTLIESMPNVYLVVDALDECLEREDLLQLLTQIASWRLDNLHILATSRRERDIEDVLMQLTSACIGLESATVDADIQVYLRTTLANDPRFKIWTVDELQEIKNALMQRAQGM